MVVLQSRGQYFILVEIYWIQDLRVEHKHLDLTKLMSLGGSYWGVVQLQPHSRLPGRHSKAHCSHKDGENMTWFFQHFRLYASQHFSIFDIFTIPVSVQTKWWSYWGRVCHQWGCSIHSPFIQNMVYFWQFWPIYQENLSKQRYTLLLQTSSASVKFGYPNNFIK